MRLLPRRRNPGVLIAAAAVAITVVAVLVPVTPASAVVASGLSGHVTGPDGKALPGIAVGFFADAGNGVYGYYDSVMTDALGNYAEPLPAGSWRIGFADTTDGDYVTEFYDDVPSLGEATTVVVPSVGWRSGVDARLEAAGHITGHVDGGTSGRVEAWVESTPGAGNWAPRYAAEVGSTGDFDLAALPPGHYVVRFVVDGFVPEFWEDATDAATATSLAVTASRTISGVDPTLTRTGRVTGHVEDTSGRALPDVTVYAYAFDGQHWVLDPDARTVTDGAGDYDLSTAPGTYRLRFSADGYLTEYYDDARTVTGGTSVTVVSGASESGVDAVLQRAASISGTVTLPVGVDPTGNEGVVAVFDAGTDKLVALSRIDAARGVDQTYPYIVAGLAPGEYRIEFARTPGPSRVEAQFFDGHPESAGPASADSVVLQEGDERTGVDAALVSGATISGVLVDGAGDPIEGCDVVAFNAAQNLMSRVGTTAADGSFLVTGLTTGYYDLVVGDVGADGGPCQAAEYYTDVDGDLSESSQHLVPVSTTTGVETVLPTELLYGADIVPSAVANTTAPSVPEEAPVVGTPISADPGTWDPSDVVVAYQWMADGIEIPGADRASYTPTDGDVGKALSVEVTASKDGYTPASALSNGTAPVVRPTQAPPAVGNTSPPAVLGVPRVGEVLSAYAGAWNPADASTALQWLRNGVPVPGATAATYALGAEDRGAHIALRVTATKAGYQPATRTSALTAPVAAGTFTVTSAPRLQGRLRVGKVLRARPPGCTPAAASVRYRWLRNGAAIRGRSAKREHYELVRADRRKRISVRITLLRPGYAPYVVVRRSGRVR